MSDDVEYDWLGLVLQGDVAYAQVVTTLDKLLDEQRQGGRVMMYSLKHASSEDSREMCKSAVAAIRAHLRDLELIKAYVVSTQA